MKLYCQKCGSRLKSEICEKCGFDNLLYYRTEKYSGSSRRGLIISLVITFAVIISLFASCVSCITCPEVWSVSAKENRAAILEYAKNNYPEAEIVEEYYPSAKFNITNKPYDKILFKLDEIEFYILARDGKVNIDDDGYGLALLSNEIEVKYLDDFFSERGLPNIADITYYDFSPYFPGKNAKLDTFPGSINLNFFLEYDEDKPTPRDYDWLFDFYIYWKDVCPTDGFTLHFCCQTENNDTYQLFCYPTSEYNDEDDFYDSFDFCDS